MKKITLFAFLSFIFIVPMAISETTIESRLGQFINDNCESPYWGKDEYLYCKDGIFRFDEFFLKMYGPHPTLTNISPDEQKEISAIRDKRINALERKMHDLEKRIDKLESESKNPKLRL